MTLLIMLLYILGILLALLLAFIIFILIIPLRYKAQAGYRDTPWFNFYIRCSPLIILRGSWNESIPLQVSITIWGITKNIDPHKPGKEVITEKEKKKGKKNILQTMLMVIDKDLRIRGITLAKELIHILKPDTFNVKGKLGFDEPHLTGWLSAITESLKYCATEYNVDLEPIWDGEYYEVEAILEGRIRTGLILIKIGWFFLTYKTRQHFKRWNKQETIPTL